MNRNEIDLALVMPHAVTNDPIRSHEDVDELCKRFQNASVGSPTSAHYWTRMNIAGLHPGLYASMVSSPLKLNPMQHLASPLMANSDKVFDTASDLGVPVIVHTGLGTPWALPSLCIPRQDDILTFQLYWRTPAIQFTPQKLTWRQPNVKNIYLEPSWCSIHDLKWLLQKIGSERILFGSDQPENVRSSWQNTMHSSWMRVPWRIACGRRLKKSLT